MMEQRLVPETEVAALISCCLDDGPVMAPQERRDQPGFFSFGWIQAKKESPESLALDLRKGYTTTTISPKKAFFPPKQKLFDFTDYGRNIESEEVGHQSFTLLGIHPCDLAALELLDWAYASPPADDHWQQRRSLATIIGINCLPDEYCFCDSMNAHESRACCDLFLNPVSRGFVAEPLTPQGKELLGSIAAESVEELDLLEMESFKSRKRKAMQSHLQADPQEFKAYLENCNLTDFWKETAQRCFSCGSCTITCPTCFCFRMEDDFTADLSGGNRHRFWDSCQLLDFSLIAGGVNSRSKRWQRVRHRWFRKFVYLVGQLGSPYCTGCGRCSRSCTADINIVSTSNELIERAREKK